MADFEPLRLDSTEIVVVNSLIRAQEREFFIETMVLFRSLENLARQLGIDIKFPEPYPIDEHVDFHGGKAALDAIEKAKTEAEELLRSQRSKNA
jgi:hypothetical protein